MPLLKLEWQGVVLRQQPPLRVEVCRTPTEPTSAGCVFQPYGCQGPARPCPSCTQPCCTYHGAWHRDTLPVPPDAWRRTLESLWAEARRVANVDLAGVLWDISPQDPARPGVQIGGNQVSRVPPWRLWYCRTPPTGHARDPCGHAARSCRGDSSTCRRCGFPYCQHHGPAHVRNLALPEYILAPILGDYRRQFDALAVAGAPRRGIKVPSPAFRVV